MGCFSHCAGVSWWVRLRYSGDSSPVRWERNPDCGSRAFSAPAACRRYSRAGLTRHQAHTTPDLIGRRHSPRSARTGHAVSFRRHLDTDPAIAETQRRCTYARGCTGHAQSRCAVTQCTPSPHAYFARQRSRSNASRTKPRRSCSHASSSVGTSGDASPTSLLLCNQGGVRLLPVRGTGLQPPPREHRAHRPCHVPSMG